MAWVLSTHTLTLSHVAVQPGLIFNCSEFAGITKPATLTFADLPTSYSGLVALHMPRPIHDKMAYDNAVEVVHALAGQLKRSTHWYRWLSQALLQDFRH